MMLSRQIFTTLISLSFLGCVANKAAAVKAPGSFLPSFDDALNEEGVASAVEDPLSSVDSVRSSIDERPSSLVESSRPSGGIASGIANAIKSVGSKLAPAASAAPSIDSVASELKPVLSSKPSVQSMKPIAEVVKSAPSLEPVASIDEIGSLPPALASAPAGMIKSSVPVQLLPSNVNVVTHEPNFGEINPKHRPLCQSTAHEVERSTIKNRNSPQFAAFEAIIEKLTAAAKQIQEASTSDPVALDEMNQRITEDDKIINYAIDVIKSSSTAPTALDWNYVASLRNCAMSGGRTIFMELVRFGHLKALSNPGSKLLLGVNKVTELRDVDNNNLLHLAVGTGSIQIVDIIIDRIGADDVLSTLSQFNIHGQTPLDIAVELRYEDIATRLKVHYSTAKALSQGFLRRGHQSPEVIHRQDAFNLAAAAATA